MCNPYCEEENENNSIQAGHLTKCYTILIVCALAASMVGRAQQTTQIFKFKGSVFQKSPSRTQVGTTSRQAVVRVASPAMSAIRAGQERSSVDFSI
jgi:hypothetical protein